MKLIDLEPRLEGELTKGTLIFKCPVCRNNPEPGTRHQLHIPITTEPAHQIPYDPPYYYKNGTEATRHVWQATGSFPDNLSLTPSINIAEVDENGNVGKTLCWHGFITNGEVT